MQDSVTSLNQARVKRNLEALISRSDPTGLFAFPFKDVLQGTDAANASKSDPIHLGAHAELATRRLMAEFGVVGQLPATYGELLGLLFYCKQLHEHAHYRRMNPADDALWEEAAEETLRKYAPEMVAPCLAYKADDKAELERISREVFTLEAMARHIDLELGWVDGPPPPRKGPDESVRP